MYKLLPLSIAVLCLAVTGCGQPDRTVRHYKEVNFSEDRPASPNAAMPAPAPSSPTPAGNPGASAMGELPPELQTPALPLAWVTPEGWEEKPGSGMRVATFMVQGQECTILTFPGDVGGDEANIRRWLGQLGVSASESSIKSFVANPVRFITAGGFECRYFDYADLIPAGSPKSALAGIIPVGDHTAFVKLMGDTAIVNGQKAAMEALCKSISLKPDSI